MTVTSRLHGQKDKDKERKTEENVETLLSVREGGLREKVGCVGDSERFQINCRGKKATPTDG